MGLKDALTSIINALVRRKSLEVSADTHTELNRCLSTLDLTFIGIGYTIGSGIFVLTGEVARYKAGPAIVISFFIAGIACLFSGLCYAEFAARFPKAGSVYVYCYVALGEFCAFVIGWTVILEYVIGGATIVKGLSSYIDSFANGAVKNETILLIGKIHVPGFSSYVDVLSVFIVVILTVILALGIKNSAWLNNFLVTVNIITLTIVTVVGFIYNRTENWKTFMPFGFRGVLQGASTCFFSFIGFDVIAITSEETENPGKSIPLSIFGTIIISLVAYVGVSAAVTLMVPYYELDPKAAISFVFVQRNLHVMMYVVVIGVIVSMLGNSLVSLIPTSRLLYSMANDGLIPSVFARISNNNIPLFGTIISNLLIATIAAILDLKALVEMMSIGTLLAYSIVAACVMVLRYRLPPQETHSNSNENDKNDRINQTILSQESSGCLKIWHRIKNLRKSQFYINIAILLLVVEISVICIVMDKFFTQMVEKPNALFIILWITLLFLILADGIFLTLVESSTEGLTFSVPLVPWTPIIALFFNISLILQLSYLTLIRFIVWMTIGLVVYFGYGMHHSVEREFPRPNEDSSKYILLQSLKDESTNSESISRKITTDNCGNKED